jgi:nucleoside-diphosphate-sugar epimerase
LVTGATAFVGSHLVDRLVADGVEVHIVVRPSSQVQRADVAVHVDDGDVDGLAAGLAAVPADACFHLASYFVAEHGPDDVAPLVESNVAFPTRLAEALGERPDLVFVNMGSAWQHVDAEPYRPAALYAATKQAFQDVLRYYGDAGRFRVVNLALFDTYGPGDPRPKLLNVMRRAQVDGTPLQMSPGDQLIDLVYVDDVVDALSAAAAAPAGAEYEVRSGRMLSLRDLFEVVEQVTGKPVPAVWGGRPYRAKEMMTPWSIGRPVPGWSPKTDLEEGIRRTWAT